MAAPEDRFSDSLYVFMVKATLWAVCTYFLSQWFAVYSFWIVVLSVAIFSAPIALERIYLSTTAQIHGLSKFASQGILYRLMSRRFLRSVFWILWALVSSFFMLVQFHTYNSVEWIAFFSLIPVFYLVFTLATRLLGRELKEHLVTSYALRWAGAVTPALMVVVFIFANLLFGSVDRYSTVQAAIDSQKALMENMAGSAVVYETAQLLAWYNGVKQFALSRLSEFHPTTAVIVIALGLYIIFFNGCAMLGSFLIPAREYRRLFGPVISDAEPAQLTLGRVALISGVITFVALFIYVPLFAALEMWIKQNSAWVEQRKRAEAKATRFVEMIGCEYVTPGTIEKIQLAKLNALKNAEMTMNEVEGEADKAFDRMRLNVDPFLDWYYSLPAEYLRIGHLLAGSLETYLEEKLVHYLQQGDAFASVGRTLNAALEQHKSALEEYKKKVSEIIGANRIAALHPSMEIARTMSLEAALTPPIHQDMINTTDRVFGGLGAGAVVGTITAVITGKIVSKAVGKATIKKAAQVLAKVIGGKAVGTLGGASAGAAIGAAAGSAVPVIGTAIGAAVGGIVAGLVTGVTVDKLLLMLEEAMNRDEFKKELLNSIESARSDFKHKLQSIQSAASPEAD